MFNLWQDIRFGLRMLGKNPGFTAIAVLTLALGIGANTAIFSLLDQVMLRHLPVKNPNELVVLRVPGDRQGHVWSDGDDAMSLSYLQFKGLRDNNNVFAGMLARFHFDASIASHGQTERGAGEMVSGDYFETLGVQPVIGRVFSREDEKVPGGHPYVVLSYGYWTRHFGGDPGVLNQPLLVNNAEMTIVGVARAGFDGVQFGQAADLFVPIMMKAQMTPTHDGLMEWNDAWVAVMGRLKPGETREQALAGIQPSYRPLLEQQLATITGWDQQKRERFLAKKVEFLPGAQGRAIVQRDTGPALVALFAMVALVLLIACTNVANLLLAQGAARQREFAIRAAMGATRPQMIRQLIVESLLCACAGGVLGIVLGSWLMNILAPAIVSNTGMEGLSSHLNGTVLGFAVAATLLSGILFGLLPAWRVTRTSVTQTLKDQGSTGSAALSHVRFRKVLVAGQVAFTVLLLAGACLYTQTLWNLRKQNLGLNTENVITFSISPKLSGYDNTRMIAMIDQLRQRFAALPGTRGVGTAEIATLTGSNMGANVTIEGGTPVPDEQNDIRFNFVSPGYVATLGIPLLAGRDIRDSDLANSQKVAIISETMAKQFMPGRNPVGMHFAFGAGKDVKPDIEIVGVVKDVKQDTVRSEVGPYAYLPYAQQKVLNGVTFYVRTQQDPLTLASSLRGQVHEMDANLPIYDLKSFTRIVDENLFTERMIAGLSAGFGGLAALLAALGIYGVLAFLVVQRTREIGIRMALGAESGSVRLLVFREVGFMALAGVLVGVPLAYGLARLSESLLFGVKANNLFVYLFSVTMIAIVAAVACYVPARRATRVDPIIALRYE